jgi:hypothetical protein
MPVEILELIIEQLQLFVNPSPECSRAFPPSMWRTALFTGGLLPWLWGLDLGVLAIECAGYEVANAWDWELLVMQLAQVRVFEEGGLMADAPLGLRKRRRIWRLIDEGRMGDVRRMVTEEIGRGDGGVVGD